MTALLEVRSIRRSFEAGPARFTRPDRAFRAVDGIDLEVQSGEAVALVGESGSGKSTLARLVLRLLVPDSGEIRFQGRDLLGARGRSFRELRRSLQGILQDPWAALDPRQTVAQAIGEAIEIHRLADARQRPGRVGSLLEEVGLDAALGARYPHEISGGERQRVALARALACEPSLLVADEPLTALDAPTRGRIVELLAQRRKARGLALLLIAHDLAAVRRLADRIAVLYLGRIIESGPTAELLTRPRHPYTQALMNASTGGWTRRAKPYAGPVGEAPDPADPPSGCSYHPRCPLARERCRRDPPELRSAGDRSLVACHFAGEIEAPPVPPS